MTNNFVLMILSTIIFIEDQIYHDILYYYISNTNL